MNKQLLRHWVTTKCTLIERVALFVLWQGNDAKTREIFRHTAIQSLLRVVVFHIIIYSLYLDKHSHISHNVTSMQNPPPPTAISAEEKSFVHALEHGTATWRTLTCWRKRTNQPACNTCDTYITVTHFLSAADSPQQDKSTEFQRICKQHPPTVPSGCRFYSSWQTLARMTGYDSGLYDRIWYWLLWPDMILVCMTGYDTGSYGRIWYWFVWPGMILARMTGYDTGSYDRIWYWLVWPDMILARMAGYDTGSYDRVWGSSDTVSCDWFAAPWGQLSKWLTLLSLIQMYQLATWPTYRSDYK
jgi:hypothetical protein